MVYFASSLHPLQRYWRTRELLRMRSSSDRLRAGAAVRAGRIDPNPHQIEAVRFALERLPEGGAILADEVGLGKTIEAGLVCAQRIAEGANRILLLAPKPLLGQWRQELESLFGLVAREGLEHADGPGIVMVGREAATSEKGHSVLREAPDFDLIIVDEAHEVFSGLYRRFDKDGEYRAERKDAAYAGNLYSLLKQSEAPVLLLTATPIQNRLVELWSLVQYIDRTGTLLGRLPTFRALFEAGDGRRSLEPLAEGELRRRLSEVVQRTLRRQAQEFLPQPFVDRHAKTFQYSLSDDERALLDDVTEYLLTPRLAAFNGSSRQLQLISFHRRMASSRRALCKSLEQVEARLEKLLAGERPGAFGERDSNLLDVADLEDDELPLVEDLDETPMTEDEIAAEIERVRGFISRARGLRHDAKLEALLHAIRLVVEERSGGSGSGKALLFTESLATQEYLRDALVESGLVQAGEVTLFRGTNDGPRAREALARWREETQARVAPADRPSADVAVRLALVHEFKTRTRIFISSEAGAKGLNLQFCETVINYDLPWNPQRIEQRIGRCHRYGQSRTVTVINFIAEDNEAEQLLYEILDRKLQLFDQVLGTSDAILGSGLVSALGPELETTLRDIHERARTREEIVESLRKLRDEFDERRQAYEQTHRQTVGLIESTFDAEVRRVFKNHAETLAGPLRGLDHEMTAVLTDYLDRLGVEHEVVETPPARYLRVQGDARLPQGFQEPFELGIGDVRQRPALHLGHALLTAASEAAQADANAWRGRAIVARPSSDALAPLRGRRGRATVVWVRVDGFEVVDLFVPIVLLDGDDRALPEDSARALLGALLEDAQPSAAPFDEVLFEDVVEEALLEAGQDLDDENRDRHHRRLSRLERSIEDRCRILGERLRSQSAQLESAIEQRDGAIGPDRRADAERRLARIEGELEATRNELEFLRSREDPEYQAMRSRTLRRRYLPPTPTRLFDVEVFIR
jgi:hypothetical protein